MHHANGDALWGAGSGSGIEERGLGSGAEVEATRIKPVLVQAGPGEYDRGWVDCLSPVRVESTCYPSGNEGKPCTQGVGPRKEAGLGMERNDKQDNSWNTCGTQRAFIYLLFPFSNERDQNLCKCKREVPVGKLRTW